MNEIGKTRGDDSINAMYEHWQWLEFSVRIYMFAHINKCNSERKWLGTFDRYGAWKSNRRAAFIESLCSILAEIFSECIDSQIGISWRPGLSRNLIIQRRNLSGLYMCVCVCVGICLRRMEGHAFALYHPHSSFVRSFFFSLSFFFSSSFPSLACTLLCLPIS